MTVYKILITIILFIPEVVGLNPAFGKVVYGEPIIKEINPKLERNLFNENHGQIVNQYGAINNAVLYNWHTGNFNVQIRSNGFSYELFRKSVEGGIEVYRIDFEYENSKIGKIDYHENQRNSSRNYGSQNSAIHFNKTQNTILIKDIYEGIDIEFLIVHNRFKYNLIIHPSANIEQLKFKINGVRPVLTENGTLEFNTGLGKVIEEIPLSYYEGVNSSNRIAKIRFKVEGNVVGFVNTSLNHGNKLLIIDPQPWCSYFGGDSTDRILKVTTDKLGNIYGLGSTLSIHNLATNGANQTTLSGTSDLFLVKCNANGSVKWITYFGGAGAEFSGGDIAVDLLGNIFIGGTTTSGGMATSGVFSTTSGLGFLTKLDSMGAKIWYTYYTPNSGISSITLDGSGNIYVGGNTTDSTGVATAGAYKTTKSSQTDAFIAKFNSSGQRIWGTYLGGNNDDFISNMKIDKSGNLYVIGNTKSTSPFLGTNGYHTVYGGGTNDGFYAKFTSSGNFLNGSFIGGSGQDWVYGLDINRKNELIVGGWTQSDTGISTPGVFMQSRGGFVKGFVQKYDPLGVLKMGTYLGGNLNDYCYSLCTDSNNNILVTGITASSDISSLNGFKTVYAGNIDSYVIQLMHNGKKQIYGTYIGGNQQDFGNSIALNGNLDVLVGGWTSSMSEVVYNGFDTSYQGGTTDGFMASVLVPFPYLPIANNKIGSNQRICTGNLPSKLNGTQAEEGYDQYAYKWLVSTLDSVSGFSDAPGINNEQDYLPASISQTNWFRRVVYSGPVTDTSNAVSITIGSNQNSGFLINKSIQCLNSNYFLFEDTTVGATTWNWYIDDTLVSIQKATNYVFGPSINNAHSVCLKFNSPLACVDSICQTVYLINNPKTSAIVGDTAAVKNYTYAYSVIGNPGSSYTWIFKNGTGSSTHNQINIKWNSLGYDTLRVIEKSGNGCFGDTISLIVNVRLKNSLDKYSLDEELMLYPNPGNGRLSLRNTTITTGSYSLINNLGITLRSGSISPDPNGEVNFDFSDLEDGIYYLQLFSESADKVGQGVMVIQKK